MKILWIATKIPWPPIDGGRLLLWNTLRALAAAGHDLTLVAPTLGDGAAAAAAVAELRPFCRLEPVPANLRPTWGDALGAQLRRRPWTVVRHTLPAVGRRVAELLGRERFDLVQAEQVQALGSVAERRNVGVPVVWRAQNVESDLWRATARRLFWRRPFLRLEARRLARFEGEAVRAAAATVALTSEDRDRLAALSGTPQRIHRVPAPFEAELPAADRPLSGSPAVVLFGSGGWLPNRRGERWFLERVWPLLRAEHGGAELHCFGPRPPAARHAGRRADQVTFHPPPADSRQAFAPGSVLAVPLEIASGVRMKILEAWARGVPVVATPAAARGLSAEAGRELLVAGSAAGFATALRKLGQRPALRQGLIDAGRALLGREHAFDHAARGLGRLYASLAAPAATGSAAG